MKIERFDSGNLLLYWKLNKNRVVWLLWLFPIITAAIVSTSCKTPAATTPLGVSTDHILAEPLDPELVDTNWQLIELNGKPFEKMKLTMLFTDKGVEGHTGCNAWSSASPLTANKGVFSLSLIRQTVDGCAHTALEKEFTYAMTDAASYVFEEDLLVLQGIANGRLLVFVPLEE